MTRDNSLERTVRHGGLRLAAARAWCSLAWGMTLAAEAGAAPAAAVLTNGDDPALTARDRALAAWARKVVADPNGTTRSDIDALRNAGLDDRAIFEATAFAAFRLAFSTVNDALGVKPDSQLANMVPPEVRSAVAYGRQPQAATDEMSK
jgi:alkylhydroperoxidase/carboxymuconolactone decarboxylase family protein YurZ